MAIRGTTVEQRRTARNARTVARRVAFYAGRIRDARTGRERLQHACDYARAVADALDDAARTDLARLIVGLADERNTKP